MHPTLKPRQRKGFIINRGALGRKGCIWGYSLTNILAQKARMGTSLDLMKDEQRSPPAIPLHVWFGIPSKRFA
jgi:hypothetical protein